MNSGLQPTKFYTWLASWVRLLEEVTCIITLSYLKPHWSIDFWAWYHRVRWVEIMKYKDGMICKEVTREPV